MKRRIAMMLMAVALASAGACGTTEDPARAPSAAAPGPASGQASDSTHDPAPGQDTAQAGPVIADQDIPVETDFEDEAAAQITADTYRAELDALETEIATEP